MDKLVKTTISISVWVSDGPLRPGEKIVVTQKILGGDTFGEFYPETPESLVWCLRNGENRKRGFFDNHEAIRRACLKKREDQMRKNLATGALPPCFIKKNFEGLQ